MTTNQQLHDKISQLLEEINEVILDKPKIVRLSLVCLLADGHLLLQDLPGMGKTTLAHTLAHLLGLSFNRVQFTNDMLPADILGMNLYNQAENKFELWGTN
ncbi:MAG: AAA family ATPase [Moraxellaceae bacterium]|nr:AAA family ATPase [Moraxellaceae bacterium]